VAARPAPLCSPLLSGALLDFFNFDRDRRVSLRFELSARRPPAEPGAPLAAVEYRPFHPYRPGAR